MKKLTTEEILAAARAQVQGGASPPPTEEPAAEQPPVEEPPEETPPPAAAPGKPAATPTSTADILAAARAQASGGGGSTAPAAKEETTAKPAAKAPTATPKTTADILAAARAQSGKGAAPATASDKPAARQPAAKAAPVAPAGDQPSVQEMVKAVREGKRTEEVAEEEVPATSGRPKLPPRPQRPSAPPVKTKPKVSAGRRTALFALLLSPFAIAWFMLSGATAAFSLALARFMMPNVLVEPPSKFKIGPPSDYPFGTVATKWKAQFGIWVIHTEYNGENVLTALLSVCTHLGCTPNWLESEQKFKCPCHGSGFYMNGVNFEGPAPRPLERMGIRVAPDGMVEVDKSVKYQEEMGQWSDTGSYVKMS